MLPAAAVPGALQQARQRREDGGRIALGAPAARPPPGRPRAAPSPRGSPSPSSAGRRAPGVAEVLGDGGGDQRARQPAPAPARRWWPPRPPSGPAPRGRGRVSMNSRTSRPRSPTRAMTLTSALVFRAIIPRSDALADAAAGDDADALSAPAGSGARRWPRTPVPSGRSMRERSIGFGRRPDRPRRTGAPTGPLPSIGRPRPSSTRPTRSSLTSA